MIQKLRPLGNNLWVEKIEEEKRTSGGIYIPDSAKQETQTGKVLAVGTGLRKTDGTIVPMQVKVGETVFFGKYAGTKAGENYIVIKEDDILGILE